MTIIIKIESKSDKDGPYEEVSGRFTDPPGPETSSYRCMGHPAGAAHRVIEELFAERGEGYPTHGLPGGIGVR